MNIIESCKNHVKTIKFNRPERKNAVNLQMYQELTNILNKDALDDNIIITIITGVGEYFSSGNDLKSAMENTRSIDNITENVEIFNKMINTFINYPKILIAVVNGPAIGIGATLPTLCDIIYASNKAFFDTPFIKMGLCLEGTCSFSYPFNLGRSKASELILLNHRLSAEEAYKFGMISEVIPHTEIDNFIEKLHRHGNLPVKGVTVNKKLLMMNFKTILKESADRESEELVNCVTSSEFLENVISFLNRKSKL